MKATSKAAIKRTEELIAYELGKLAFENGIHVFVFDASAEKMMEGRQVGEGMHVLKAWNRGHTVAMLNAPIEEQE